MQLELERRERQERVQNARLRASQAMRLGRGLAHTHEYIKSWNLQAHTTLGENVCLRCITHHSSHRADSGTMPPPQTPIHVTDLNPKPQTPNPKL